TLGGEPGTLSVRSRSPAVRRSHDEGPLPTRRGTARRGGGAPWRRGRSSRRAVRARRYITATPAPRTMDRLNLVSFIFLVVLFVLAPRAALRSARLLRELQTGGQPLPRRRMVLSTMFSLSVLWALSAINADAMGRGLFAVWRLGPRELVAGVAGFAVLLAAI